MRSIFLVFYGCLFLILSTVVPPPYAPSQEDISTIDSCYRYHEQTYTYCTCSWLRSLPFSLSLSIQVYPDLAGLGADTHHPRTRSPDSDDIADTHTVRTDHSSLTLWTSNRVASLESTLTDDDDDRTLPVYQPHSVRKSMIGSKAMTVVEPHDAGSGFWGAFRLFFDSFLNSFKSCLPGA